MTIVRPLSNAHCCSTASRSSFSRSSAVPLAADARGDAKKQVEFGIAVAQRGLWREAIYRWERATQIDPTYAAAHNNLAIAYEHEGDSTRRAPRTRRRSSSSPDNALIKQNYELFKEINDRTTRQGRSVVSSRSC